MSHNIQNKKSEISESQLREYFHRSAKMRKEKKENQQKLITDQLMAITKGKNIVILNSDK
jgi:hypothetical protein